MFQPRPRQPLTTTHARVHTRARASTHTNADSMSATLNCAAVHACRQKVSAPTSSTFTTGVTSCSQQATPRRVASANLFVHRPIRRRNTGTAHAPAAADSNVVADTNTADVPAARPESASEQQQRSQLLFEVVLVVFMLLLMAPASSWSPSSPPSPPPACRPQGCVVSTTCPSLPWAFPP